jgi:tRNA A37 threonylcarbamoyladenosine modification protein TsaB
VVKDEPPSLMNPEGLRAVLESNPEEMLVVGDVDALPSGWARGLHRVKSGLPRYPSARALLEVGMAKLEREGYPDSGEVRPLYLRDPDVTLNWDKLRPEGPWSA